MGERERSIADEGAQGSFSKPIKGKYIIMAFAGYVLSIAIYAIVVRKFSGDDASAGQFGDMFGCFTAFFNGLALFGIAYTVVQQLQQLKIQNSQIKIQNRELKIQNSAHIISTLDILHNRWNEKSMLAARRRACERELAGLEKFSQSMQHVAEYFEHMGVLVRLQAIDSKLIWDLYSWYIVSYWHIFRSRILEVRSDNKDPSAYSEFESLYNAMMEITKANSLPTFDRSDKEKLEFARSDKKLAERLLANHEFSPKIEVA